MFEGRLQIGEGPSWHLRGKRLARVVNTGSPSTSIIETEHGLWTISRKPPPATGHPVGELAGRTYELSTGDEAPAVWTEELGVAAMRTALTDHVGVGLSWSDRWVLAGATARAIPLMADLVTATQRYELRPRFEAVATQAAGQRPPAVIRLLRNSEVVAEGGVDSFHVTRPVPLEVVLLASFVVLARPPT